MTGARPTPSEATRQPENFVRALDRGLAVIRAFTKERPNLTLSEVARSSGLTRAAARRFVLTLVDLGYVGIKGQTYHLRPWVLELGFACLSTMTLPDVARPHLSQLSEDLGRSISIAGRWSIYQRRGVLHAHQATATGQDRAQALARHGYGDRKRPPARGIPRPLGFACPEPGHSQPDRVICARP
ncbi:MAG: helix-turn-helix domain-containing protein [Nocardioidaceae bacterium]